MDYVEELAWKLFKSTGEIRFYSLYKNLESDRVLESQEVQSFENKYKEEEEMEL